MSNAMYKIKKGSTAGKKYPFFFTECTAIGARSTFPCQDTPSAKVTATAKITVDKTLKGLFTGILQNQHPCSDSFITYEYTLKIPISTYLIVFAVGDVEFVKLSDRCGVWCEPGLIKDCQKNFKDIETYLTTAESLLGKFEWEYFILLILPYYKYWGMENPYLTYINSDVMHMKLVVFHELSHFWTGNLITNSTWENFWINEGFTTFLERKLICIFLGKEEFKKRSKMGYENVCNVIRSMGVDNNYTSLNPTLECVSE